MTQQIISLMPVHRTYVEPFLAKSPIFRIKRPAELNLGADMNPTVVKWWEHRLGPAAGGEAARRVLAQGVPAVPSLFENYFVVCLDALRLLSRHPAMQDPLTLVYLDPPYLRSACSSRGRYVFAFSTAAQHRKLLAAACKLPCMVMTSGYASPLYTKMLAGWRTHSFPGCTRGGVRTEMVWMNFPVPAVLYDPRFIGRNFRERERIKRKRARWVSRLAAMPAAERQMIAEALAEVSGGKTPARAASAGIVIPGDGRSHRAGYAAQPQSLAASSQDNSALPGMVKFTAL